MIVNKFYPLIVENKFKEYGIVFAVDIDFDGWKLLEQTNVVKINSAEKMLTSFDRYDNGLYSSRSNYFRIDYLLNGYGFFKIYLYNETLYDFEETYSVGDWYNKIEGRLIYFKYVKKENDNSKLYLYVFGKLQGKVCVSIV